MYWSIRDDGGREDAVYPTGGAIPAWALRDICAYLKGSTTGQFPSDKRTVLRNLYIQAKYLENNLILLGEEIKWHSYEEYLCCEGTHIVGVQYLGYMSF